MVRCETNGQPTLAPHPPQKFAPEAPAIPLDEVVDLQQKLAILQQKRQEDKAKIKELEKYRAQLQQVIEGASAHGLFGELVYNVENVKTSLMSSGVL